MTFNVLVCVKQVLDSRLPLKLGQDGTSVIQGEPDPVFILDPASRAALEEAMHLGGSLGAEVTAAEVGTDGSLGALRACLARGVDRVVHVRWPQNTGQDSWGTAWALSELVRKRRYDLVLCGDRSLDGCSGLVGPALAQLLDLPQVTRAVRLEIRSGSGRLIAHRLLDRGNREILECALPAVVTLPEHAREPRYISIRRRQLSRGMPVETFEVPASREIPAPRCRTQQVDWPRPRPKKLSMPEPTMSAADRMQFLMTGGRTKKRERVFEGTDEQATEALVSYLQEHGLLPGISSRDTV